MTNWNYFFFSNVCSGFSAGVYQLPGVADVVDVFADVPQPVGVPRQGGVDRYGDDLTPQWEAEFFWKNHHLKQFKKIRLVLFIFFNALLISPEDVLTHGGEPRDVLIVDDVRVQRRLRHQVGSGQWRMHQGVTWKSNIVNGCQTHGVLHKLIKYDI